jgi:aldose 1-epimerase
VTRRPPSGEQHTLTHGRARAVVTQVGATLRHYSVNGHDVIDGFDEPQRAHDGRGQVLAPWPNRITDGHYRFKDQDCQAPLNEPARHDAIHGLVRWLDWTLVGHDGSSVSLACTLWPQPGYEWQLELLAGYALADDGLIVTLRAVNVDSRPAPFGAGSHPYLAIGPGTADDAELLVPAVSYLDPNGLRSVDGTTHDFTRLRRIGPTELDTAYGALLRGDDGRTRVTVAGADGRGVELWADAAFGWFMVYTADEVGDPGRRRCAVAVEPMTCPPEAFRTGTDVVELDPGASWSGTWGVRPIAAG